MSIATRIKSSSWNCCKIEEACLWHEWCPSTMVERLGQSTLQLWCGSDTSWPMWLCVVLKRVSQNGTERALHEGMAQMTSQLNRVCDHREMQHLRECWIPLKEARQIRCRNHHFFCRWSLRKRRNRNGTTCPSQTYMKTFFKLVQKNGMACSSQGKEFVRWGILNQDQALRLAKNRLLKNWKGIPVDRSKKEDLHCTPTMHTRYKSLAGQINWFCKVWRRSSVVTRFPDVLQRQLL